MWVGPNGEGLSRARLPDDRGTYPTPSGVLPPRDAWQDPVHGRAPLSAGHDLLVHRVGAKLHLLFPWAEAMEVYSNTRASHHRCRINPALVVRLGFFTRLLLRMRYRAFFFNHKYQQLNAVIVCPL